MKRLLFVDYMGNSDSKGKPIGHSTKVLREYIDLLCSNYEIGVAAPQNILALIDDYNVTKHPLDYHICIDANSDQNKKDMRRNNLNTITTLKGYDLIWFYVIDNYFFQWALFHPFLMGKSICTSYQETFSSRKTDLFYSWVKKHIGLIISTSPQVIDSKAVHIPDYFYDKEKYKGLFGAKKDIAVCVGTVGPEKNIEQLIPAFNDIQYELIIAGHFRDKERLNYLYRLANNNIHISDSYLSDEEYIQILGEAKFAVLPYRMNSYKNRTSGVLQECVFTKTVPIAPIELLEENRIPGISLESFMEKPEIIIDYNLDSIYSEMDDLIISVFDKETIKAKLCNRFNSMY